MSHQCSHALIRCMDFRLEGAIQDYLKHKNLVNDCDVISLAGAGKDLIENENGFLSNQIELSKKLHSTNTFIIMHHMDCGGYGGHNAFESIEKEREFQIQEMRKVEEIIKSKYPDVNIVKVLADISDSGNVVIEEI